VSSSGDCEPFYYGGCEGNNNRFESADECEAECNGMAAATTRPPAQHTDRPPVDSRPDDSDSTGSLSYDSIVVFCIALILYCTYVTGLGTNRMVCVVGDGNNAHIGESLQRTAPTFIASLSPIFYL